jgi:hypothetical protein
MEISVTGKGWRCFRRPGEHKGRNPTRLVQAILGCSFDAAALITGQSIYLPGNFMAQVQNYLTPKEPLSPKKLLLPPEFKPFNDTYKPSSRNFRNYLYERGFTPLQVNNITKVYQVRYCTTGPYDGRIIFPVYANRQLMTWTGRTIHANQNLRYKTLSTDAEKSKSDGLNPAYGPITNFLLWQDDLNGISANTLILTEGPFDALKTNVLGRQYRIEATCCFTSQPSVSQVDLLHQIAPRYKRCLLLLDQGTLPTAIKVSAQLAPLGFAIRHLPNGIKDPGELNANQLLRIVNG